MSTIVPIVVIVTVAVFLFLLNRRVSSIEETLSDLVVQHNAAATKLNNMGKAEEISPPGIEVQEAPVKEDEPKSSKKKGKDAVVVD